jgi:membrane protease YdiL (CAAX protease family)
MKNHNPNVNSPEFELPKSSADAPHSECIDTKITLPLTTEILARPFVRVTFGMLGSLLLGVVAIVGSILVFRQGLLPLIEAVFHIGPDWISVIRRTGILLAAIGSYWAFVRLHEKRAVTELHLRPIHILLGGVSGVTMVALPLAVLFTLGVYELVLFRGIAPALLGVATIIGIAATLEELVYRCLLFRLLERAWGTKSAVVVQAVVFALQHLGNVEQGKANDVVTMLISVTLVGMLWAGVFVLTRNLWVVAANHAAWNFTILLSGLPLSGLEDWRKLAPLESRFAGPDFLTGGMFGPESSLLVIASTSLVVLLLMRMARKRGAFFTSTA